jgi:histone H3/H4
MSSPVSAPNQIPNIGPPPANLTDAAFRINKELNRRASRPMVLSPHAKNKLELVHAEYLADIGEEAIRAARRADLATVDEIHVDHAVERLGARGNSSLVDAICNPVGGVIAGAGVASVYAIMFTAGPHSDIERFVSIALCVIGAILLTIGISVTVFRRKK